MFSTKEARSFGSEPYFRLNPALTQVKARGVEMNDSLSSVFNFTVLGGMSATPEIKSHIPDPTQLPSRQDFGLSSVEFLRRF